MLKINWLQNVIRHTLWKTVAEGMDKRGKVMPSRVCLTQYARSSSYSSFKYLGQELKKVE